MLFVLRLVGVSWFCAILALSNATSQLVFEVPYPAGILVTKREVSGTILRQITIERSAVALRPQWARVYSMPVFSPNESAFFIDRAESYASTTNNWGAEHSREDELPSVDVPVHSLFSNEDFLSLQDYLSRSVLATMAKHFQLNPTKLHIRDMFIAKYNASSTKRSHAPHKDKSAWSFIIALNSQRRRGTKLGSGFDGGGTRFLDLKEHWVQPVGEAIMFTGKTLHEGVEVTRGVRYIMAGFCEYADDWWTEYDPNYDGHAAAVGLLTGDVITAIQACSMNEQGILVKTMQSVHNVSDEEWLQVATSCEVLEPQGNIVIAIERNG